MILLGGFFLQKRELGIATINTRTGVFLSKEIKKVFNEKVKIKRYSFEDRSIEKGINCNLIIILEEAIFEPLKKYVKEEVEIIIAKRTISKKGFRKITGLKDQTKAMLVNVGSETAMETISLIYQLGAKNIELTPVYPGLKEIPDLNWAITPGEKNCVPESVDNVIDIGNRVLDISTIFDIAVKLNLENILEKRQTRRYFDNIMPVSLGLEKIIGKKNSLEGKLNILLQSLDVAIIGINSNGMVNSFNISAEKILGLKRENILGESYKKDLKEIPFKRVLKDKKAIEDKVVKIGEISYVITINPIKKYDTINGAVAIVKKLSETVKEQNKIRAQLIDKGHIANYEFNDIVGESDLLQKAKKIALRMADSNSTVLITGDTGTGKELFAQAIHNESKRKDNQFVAINCAALPESLLESELFGYEKGAFTGAKKEGKMGLFELAHHGTLFLDEISEMPLKLQSRLLRVLEQRKVMRIGGDSVINIDVRIIAATNRVLKDLVNRGEFRKDLFYRLSVLPLKIPSLNEREKDVILLIKKFKSDLNADYKLSEEVIELFLSHEWQGNVRELRNYLEFFANLNKGDIGIEDLPFTFDESRKVKYNLSEQDKDILNSLHSQIAPPKLDNYIFVLSELDKRFKNNQSTGRRSITKAAKKQEIYITEQDIRNIYQRLDKLGLVKIKKGRGGTRITKRGKRIVDFLIKNNN